MLNIKIYSDRNNKMAATQSQDSIAISREIGKLLTLVGILNIQPQEKNNLGTSRQHFPLELPVLSFNSSSDYFYTQITCNDKHNARE